MLGHVLRRGFVLQHRNSRCFATAVCLPTLVSALRTEIYQNIPSGLDLRLSFLSLPPCCWLHHHLLDSRLAFACKLAGSLLLLLKHPLSLTRSLARSQSSLLTATSSRCCFGCSNVLPPRSRHQNGYVNLPLLPYSSSSWLNDYYATTPSSKCQS